MLDDHGVLASVGSIGDAYDNALAESFVDSFKTELIADRVSRSEMDVVVKAEVARAMVGGHGGDAGAGRPARDGNDNWSL